MGEEITINPYSLPIEDWQQKTPRYLECERRVFDQFRSELEEAFRKGFKNVVIVNGKLTVLAVDEINSFGEIEARFPNQPYYVFEAPPVTFIEKPSTMEEYVKFIQSQALRKGWSKNPQWLQNSVFKEFVEVIKAIEGAKSDDEVGSELADVLYFLWQYVKAERPNVNMDVSLIAKMKDNEMKKKKTIDAEGNLVRK